LTPTLHPSSDLGTQYCARISVKVADFAYIEDTPINTTDIINIFGFWLIYLLPFGYKKNLNCFKGWTLENHVHLMARLIQPKPYSADIQPKG
jgi:hypothetical protein